MSGEKKQRWPASWPPFWRAVLHVAIATGVGNVVLACGEVLAREYPFDSGLGVVLHVIPAGVGCVATVLLCTVLARAGRRTIFVFSVAFLSGAVVMATCGFLLVLDQTRIFETCRALLDELVGPDMARFLLVYIVLPPVVALLGFTMVRERVRAMGLPVSRRRAGVALLTGVLLIWIGTGWAAAEADSMYDFYRNSLSFGSRELWDFITSISVFTFYPLAFAVTARMLIGAPEEAKSPGMK